MGSRSLSLMFVILLLAASAFGQTVTFTWPSCPSVPAGFSGLCQNTDATMTMVWAPSQTFPPPVLPLPLAGSGAGITTGPTSTNNGKLAQFTGTNGQLTQSTFLASAVVLTSTPIPESQVTNLTADLASKQAVLPAKGTVTVGATQIAANSCTAAATVAILGTTAASVINFTPSVDITSVTGWGTTGGLVIAAWPTQDTVNYKVCNQSPAAITPSASVTFNVGTR